MARNRLGTMETSEAPPCENTILGRVGELPECEALKEEIGLQRMFYRRVALDQGRCFAREHLRHQGGVYHFKTNTGQYSKIIKLPIVTSLYTGM